MLKLDLSNDAIRFLKKRDNKQFLQLLNAVNGLCIDPRPTDSIALGEDFFRKDAGEYRIVYKFDAKLLSVFVIGLRNDGAAYQELDRKK